MSPFEAYGEGCGRIIGSEDQNDRKVLKSSFGVSEIVEGAKYTIVLDLNIKKTPLVRKSVQRSARKQFVVPEKRLKDWLCKIPSKKDHPCLYPTPLLQLLHRLYLTPLPQLPPRQIL